MKHCLIALACGLPLLASNALAGELVDIRWTAEGRFVHQATLAPAKFAELCGPLAAGTGVRWDFQADAPLDFNVHYHQGKAVVFPAKLSAVAQAADTLGVKVAQDYCWMWTNKSAVPVALSVTLQCLGGPEIRKAPT